MRGGKETRENERGEQTEKERKDDKRRGKKGRRRGDKDTEVEQKFMIQHVTISQMYLFSFLKGDS